MITRKEARSRLVFALDVWDIHKAIHLLDQLQGKVGIVKVNSLAVAYPEIISEIQRRGIKVWLDFKWHDIPGTVENFVDAAVKDRVDVTTIHTLGGLKMLEAAVKAAASSSDLKILGITILTSHDQESFNEELGIKGAIQDKVVDLALMAEKAGLDGVVASAKEAKELRKVLKPETLIVTPGIKPFWAVKREDQERITSPKQAILNGADWIVVGSAIHKSLDAAEAADSIVDEIEDGLRDRSG